jgi:hypothetical protein
MDNNEVDQKICELFKVKSSNQISKSHLMRVVLKQHAQLGSGIKLFSELTYFLFCENPGHPFIQELPKESLKELRRKRFNDDKR